MALIQDPNDTYQPVTLEAHDLVFGDRNAAYGHPFDDFSTTGDYLTTYLQSRGLLNEGARVIAEDVAPIMSLVKLSRYANGINTGNPKRDTTVDKAGYAETEWRVIEERKRRAQVTLREAERGACLNPLDFNQEVQDKARALWLQVMAGEPYRSPSDAELGGLFRQARDFVQERRAKGAVQDYSPPPPAPARPERPFAPSHFPKAETGDGRGPLVMFMRHPEGLTFPQHRMFGTLEVLEETERLWEERCCDAGLAFGSLVLAELGELVREAKRRVLARRNDPQNAGVDTVREALG